MTTPDQIDCSLDRRRLLQGGALLAASTLVVTGIDAVTNSAQAATEDPGLVPIPMPAQVPAKEGMLKLKDVSLYYWDTGGSGTPIILFHPFTGSGKVWQYQQPVFAKAGYRVIGYSRRGFNGSESGPKDKPGTGSGDVLEMLDVLGIQKFHAVASAGGAFVAADFAISYPERLQSLVLACSILGASGGEFSKMTKNLRPPGYENLSEAFHELSPSYRAANPEGTDIWTHNQETSRNGEGGINQPYANKITLEALEKFTIPVLLMGGGADLIAPPPVVRLFAKHIPKSELVIVNEAGHSAYWERPDVFNAAVLKFIRKHRK
ncbi:MAG: alpha/beta hydrolase [Steroidobacteraceae bacterium]